MPKIEIRPINSEDVKSLKSIDHAGNTTHVWQMERKIDEGQVTINFREIRLPRKVRVEYPRKLSYLTNSISSDETILVARLEEITIGYVRVKVLPTINSLSVVDLVVDKDQRRQGVGSALVFAAQEWGIQHGLRRMILETQSKNYAAIQLAQKLGYEFCGYNDHYYENQDIALFFARYLR